MPEENNKIFHRKKILAVFLLCTGALLALFGRLVYLMIWRSDYYSQRAVELHERERSIKAARGRIVDRTGKVLADNKTVCTVSVIHNQIENPDEVVRVLSGELGLSWEYVRKRVEKYSSMERIQSNVEKSIGDRIREYDLAGVKVDEDYKRFYPYGELGSKVLGFTGGDNQGIIGLEVVYEEYLQGKPGTILTVTDARGIEVEEAGERRVEPEAGADLHVSLDMNIQSYATQLARQAMETKSADSVSILVMNPQNGELLAMMSGVSLQELLPEGTSGDLTGEEEQNLLNGIWRNGCINDTYEPGSTFKIITAAAGLEEGVVTPESSFSCPGYIMVEDRRIRCHKTTGHGAEDFIHATMNSCNPVFITVGMRLGVENYYKYFEQFGLLKKTGVDLPGEAGTIMHKPENMGLVELATVSFGQSFQITPHLGVYVSDRQGETVQTLAYPVTEGILSQKTSETLRGILEKVVSEGGGKNGQVEGYRVGGKTATSQTLPRGSGRYIASFLGFAPADNPQVIALAIVNNPQGVYYGGQVAAPIVRQLFENILPYLEIEGWKNEQGL